MTIRAKFGLAVACLGMAGSQAQAQFPVASGPPIVLGSPVAVASSPVVTSNAVPVNGDSSFGSSRGVDYALPFLSRARREARTANRYTVARPVYAGRPGVSFAPYSDYYFPRTIGARETVYTAAPNAPVPVGYRVFARPNGTPVFPR